MSKLDLLSNNTFNLKLVQSNESTLLDCIQSEKEFKSHKEFLNHLMKKLQHALDRKTIETNSAKHVERLDTTDLFNFINSNVPLKYIQVSSRENKTNRTFYIRDYDNDIPVWKEFNLPELISTFGTKLRMNVPNVLNDISKRLNTTAGSFMSATPIRQAPKHIILTRNAVVNVQTMEYSNSIDAFGEYDFTNCLEYNIVNEKQVNPVMLEVVKRIMDDWSENNKEKLHLLKQLGIAAMDGNGRRVYNFIIGSGGNGKSTFLNILRQLAGPKYTSIINIHQLSDDNKFGDVQSNTKLLLGHDLATNTKISSGAISRLKELITGEAIKINVKFEEDKLIQTNCLKIQSTNTDIDILENTDATRRRFRLIQWTNKNFSKLSGDATTDFDLDALVGIGENGIPNKEFFEAFIHYIFIGMKPFTEFIEIEEITQATNNMLNNADIVYQFINALYEKDLLQFSILPNKYLYEMYKRWSFIENPGSKPLKQTGFTNRAKQVLPMFGYEYATSRKRMSAIKKYEFNEEILELYNLLPNYEIEKTLTPIYYFESTNPRITEEDISNLKEKLDSINLDDLTTKDIIIIFYLADIYDNDTVIQLKQDILFELEN